MTWVFGMGNLAWGVVIVVALIPLVLDIRKAWPNRSEHADGKADGV